MTLSEELTWRGFINQTTLSDLALLDDKLWTFYHGFDASADSQTVGNLAAMMLDRAFMRHGHKAIILAGGATSLIGDPGGKDSERPLQSEETISHNVAKAEEQLKKVFHGFEFRLVNNLDWTKDLTVIEFLRDIGKHFSMTPLVQRDYIAKRLGEGGSGLSYAEFSYTILQGMDFLHLFDKHGCTLQLGGSDQWGNCLSGVELIRRTRGKEAHVITLPLIINKTTGKKFGKSEDGAVWLDPAKTSPTQFYQFWINLADDGVEDFLKIYTELGKDEVDSLLKEHNAHPAERKAQIKLAREVTSLVHGQQAMQLAEEVTFYLTGHKKIAEASDSALAEIRKEITALKVPLGANMIEVLVGAGLATSNTEARRLLADKAVFINGQKVEREKLEASDFQNGRLLLRKGKKFKDSALIELS
ncbi:MAG TPA: tyrosine--tRNA ligase [Candidatus Saccharimonadales bacterium]|nr:tyrosine--tRNA ligase [Candidatus Saccharimonadales bacterium]